MLFDVGDFMKKIFLAMAITTSTCFSFAAKLQMPGSDTMAGVMTDAIVAAGLDKDLNYAGGGSGVGEKAFANGEVGLTAMSRPMSIEAKSSAMAKGITTQEHIIGLDGIAIFANKSNPIQGLDLATLVKIFKCETTAWNQIPGSGKAGPIKVYRRNDQSGTTDTFKSMTGLKAFGACVVVLNETTDIGDHTAREPEAIGYAGLSGKKDGNRTVALSRKSGEPFVLPTAGTIRNEKYPLSRKLFVYSAQGSKNPSKVEKQLLDAVTDRSFIDPILQAHDFVTLN